LTKLEIQKLAYFLQVAGEPLKLEYVKHRYGPYAENLNFLLQRVEGHFIRGYGDRSKEAEIHVLTNALGEAEEFLAGSPEAIQHLERVAELIDGFENPYRMELLATVHWVAARDLDATNEPAQVVASVQQWNARKRDLFTPEHIEAAWERLHTLGWLPSAGGPGI